MLTLRRQRRRILHPVGHRCDATARTPYGGHVFCLGIYQAATPRLALRWMASRVGDITDQLAPSVARAAHHWLVDQAEHERALNALAEGRSYTFTIADFETRFVLTIRVPEQPRRSRLCR